MSIIIDIILIIIAGIAAFLLVLAAAFAVHCIRSHRPKQYGYDSPAVFDMRDTIQAKAMAPRSQKSDVDAGEILHCWDEQGGNS